MGRTVILPEELYPDSAHLLGVIVVYNPSWNNAIPGARSGRPGIAVLFPRCAEEAVAVALGRPGVGYLHQSVSAPAIQGSINLEGIASHQFLIARLAGASDGCSDGAFALSLKLRLIIIQRHGACPLRLKCPWQLLRSGLHGAGQTLGSVKENRRFTNPGEGIRHHRMMIVMRPAEAGRHQPPAQTELDQVALPAPEDRAAALEVIKDLHAAPFRPHPGAIVVHDAVQKGKICFPILHIVQGLAARGIHVNRKAGAPGDSACDVGQILLGVILLVCSDIEQITGADGDEMSRIAAPNLIGKLNIRNKAGEVQMLSAIIVDCFDLDRLAEQVLHRNALVVSLPADNCTPPMLV